METKILRIAATLGVPGLSLGVFYLLLRAFDFRFEAIPGVWAAAIAIIFLIVVGGITIFALHRFGPKEKEYFEYKSAKIPADDQVKIEAAPQQAAPPVDPKFAALQQRQNDVWTVQATGRRISDSRPIGSHREADGCRILTLDVHYVQIELLGSQLRVTIPLGDIVISYDDRHHRPMMELRA